MRANITFSFAALINDGRNQRQFYNLVVLSGKYFHLTHANGAFECATSN